MKITIELFSTLELEALESALDMFSEYAKEVDRDTSIPSVSRERSRCEAGLALLKRVRHGK